LLKASVAEPGGGERIAEEISAESGQQIFVPRGLAHGFCTLEPNTEVAYQVDSYYAPASESGIIWNDPSLNIPWPVGSNEAILSEKDRQLGTFKDLMSPFAHSDDADQLFQRIPISHSDRSRSVWCGISAPLDAFLISVFSPGVKHG
jgi:hypothetical protein